MTLGYDRRKYRGAIDVYERHVGESLEVGQGGLGPSP